MIDASMNCPNCGAYMRLIWKRPTSRVENCPHCGRGTSVYDPDGIIIAFWKCDRCHAVVDEPGELATLRKLQGAVPKT